MDPLSDMLTRIRNAYAGRLTSTSAPYSKIKLEVARLLSRRGFVGEVTSDDREIKISLKYDHDVPAIESISRVSRPGLRVYRRAEDFKRVRGGLGFLVVSTSQGLMTGDDARKKRIGGEVLAEVY